MALLQVEDLHIGFSRGKDTTQAVQGVSFRLKHSQTVCLVGESGSGKSLTARAVMGLLPEGSHFSGTIRFDGEVVTDGKALSHGHEWCGRGMAMIFQEPMAGLNPSMRVQALVGEAYRLRFGATPSAVKERVCTILEQTGILSPAEILDAYPWQLSGGLAQRVMIASSLILKPRLLIADEPTTALDVTTQAQILRVLARLRQEQDLALLFITHDLSVAALMGGITLVMNSGRVMEQGKTLDILHNPSHPYTRNLVACMPSQALAEGRQTLSPNASADLEVVR